MDQVRLNPPATAKAIADAEVAFGCSFTPDLADSLRIHDGQDGGGLEMLGGWRLYDLHSMDRAWRMMMDMSREETILWKPTWIPIASDGNGNHLIVDLASGRVASVPRLVEDPSTVAPSFLSWLETITTEITSG